MVAYRNEVNPDCLVEAEFGFIGSGSSIKDAIPEGVSEETMTKPNEAKEFKMIKGYVSIVLKRKLISQKIFRL